LKLVNLAGVGVVLLVSAGVALTGCGSSDKDGGSSPGSGGSS
jgi:hypothetical protein